MCDEDGPTNLTLAYNIQFLAELTWEDNSGNETGFEVERSIGGGAYTPVTNLMGQSVSIGPNETSFTDTVVVFGQNVDYRVRAVGAAYQSAWSNITSFSQPATIQDLDISLDCYDVSAGELVWDIYNPNAIAMPGQVAQWWSSQGGQVLVLPGNNTYRTTVNAQNPATYGDDNITGVWWIDETLIPDDVNDIVMSIDYTNVCTNRQRQNRGNMASAREMLSGGLRYYLRMPEASAQSVALLEGIQVYPNPTRGKLSIESADMQGTAILKVFNQLGQLVFTQGLELGLRAQANLDALQPGVYKVQIETEMGTTTRRVIKR